MKTTFALTATLALLGSASSWAQTTVEVSPGESLQVAIDALPDSGGIVELAAGSHVLTSTIVIADRTNITIRGAGMYATTLSYGGRYFQVTASDRIVLRDFGCVGGGGISLYAETTNSVVENVRLDANGVWENREGIGIGNAGDGSSVENNVVVRGCVLRGKGIGAYDYASRVTFEGNTVDGFWGPQYAAIDMNRVSNITVRDNTVRNTSQALFSIGVYVSTADVSGNLVEDNDAGLWVYDIRQPTAVRNNVIRRNATYGIRLYQDYPVEDHASACTVTGNLIYANGGNGILIEKSGGNNVPIDAIIESNTLYGNGSHGIDNSQAQAGVLRNNIVAGNAGYGITGAGMTLSYNNFWGNGQGDYDGAAAGTGDISADPLFVDPAAGDFRLRAGSPCIDAGLDVGLPFVGAAPDMGALEFGASEPSAGGGGGGGPGGGGGGGHGGSCGALGIEAAILFLMARLRARRRRFA